MKDSIFVFQRKYAKHIVKKSVMENGRHKYTPISTHVNLSKDEQGVTIDHILYRSMIDVLICDTVSLLYITLYVGVCTHFQSNPMTTNLTQVKRITKRIVEHYL